MSLQSFQSALAYVIRSHDLVKEHNLQDICQQYELNSDEKHALVYIWQQKFLKAYSEEMYIARLRIITESVEFLYLYIDKHALRSFFDDDFEPINHEILYEHLVEKFMEQLLSTDAGQKLLTVGAPPFLVNVIQYLHCVFSFMHGRMPKSVTVPVNSLLTGRYFKILDLNYDVRYMCSTFLGLHHKRDVTEKLSREIIGDPPKQDLTIMFVDGEKNSDFRTFEINQELKTFLLEQVSSNQADKYLPSCYGDLVEMGLCRPLDKSRGNLTNFKPLMR
jgi:hypothetical protein